MVGAYVVRGRRTTFLGSFHIVFSAQRGVGGRVIQHCWSGAEQRGATGHSIIHLYSRIGPNKERRYPDRVIGNHFRLLGRHCYKISLLPLLKPVGSWIDLSCRCRFGHAEGTHLNSEAARQSQTACGCRR